MIDRTTRLRWRRRLRSGKRQVEDISYQAEEQLERHFFKRLAKLPNVFRFTFTWLALVILLIGSLVVQTRALGNYYLNDKPVPGGTYTEGILGTFTNANPLYATDPVDSSVSHLVFSGLLKLDSENLLTGDLADSWQVDASGLNYTVHLHKGLTWQDGKPLTASDVVFTYQTIQNPDAKSPLYSSWQGITVTAIDVNTVNFNLPNPLSSFPYSLINGIVPQHLLKAVPLEQLRSVSFNSANPIGAGPFKWSAIEVSGDTPDHREEQIALLPFDKYVRGAPKLSKFIIKSFHDEKNLLTSFRHQELNGAAGLSALPDGLKTNSNVYEYDIPVLGETMVFFKTTSPLLSDVRVRQALTMATNRDAIINKLGYPVIGADEPVLKSQFAYDRTQAELGFDVAGANKLLDEAGWAVGTDGIRSKGGVALSLALYSQDNPDYVQVSKQLQKQWKAVGVEAQLNIESATDLQTKQLDTHAYDVLLYGIEIGVDPDVFAYWDSTQADVRSQSRLNFSEYKSATADAALESGRTRLDPTLRAIKYQPFLKAWRADAPAVALYQPRFLYITRGQVFGFTPTGVSSSVDRYANVNNWMIREDKLPK